MLATLGPLPEGEQWQYEFKWDGVRAIVGLKGGTVQAISRNNIDFTASYPELQSLPAQTGQRELVLDGELVALDATGAPSFSQLQQRMHVRTPSPALVAKVPVLFYCFDLLALDGKRTTGWTYEKRRAALEDLPLAEGLMQLSPRFHGPGASVFETARTHGLEGVVAKVSTSVYEPGRRSKSWIKVPISQSQEGIIIGWRPGEGRREGTLGSLLLAAHEPDGKQLSFIGAVGTGFTQRMLDDLLKELQPLEVPDSVVTGRPVPQMYARDAHWTKPKLVGEVQFRNWTPDVTMRHPSWRGLRIDKRPKDVRLSYLDPNS